MTDDAALIEFIANCDVLRPPPEGAYVERQRSVSRSLASRVGPSPTARVLLVGQPGVGKSTEFGRFASDHADKFKALRPPIDVDLSLADTTWHELLVYSAGWAAEADGELARTGAASALRDAFTPRRLNLDWAGTGGPPHPTPTQFFRNDQAGARRTIAAGPAQYWDLAVDVLHAAETQSGRPLVLLLDGLEKLSITSARKLFVDQRRWLEKLPTRAIIAAPLALSFEADFGLVEESVMFVERLRAVDWKRDPGRAFLRRVAAARGAGTVMSDDVLARAIDMSGGLPRQLLQIVALAASQALGDGVATVHRETLEYGIYRAADRWQYQLGAAELEALRAADAERSAAVRANLYRLAALLEIDTADGTFATVTNPLVERVLSRSGPANGSTP